MDVTEVAGRFGDDEDGLVYARLETSEGDVPVRLVLKDDAWLLVVGSPSWDTYGEWPRDGRPVASGVVDDEYEVIIRDAATRAWPLIQGVLRDYADPVTTRQVYAEDITSGMVLVLDSDARWESPQEVTVLDVRQRDNMVSVIVVDPHGEQRAVYLTSLQQARMRVDG